MVPAVERSPSDPTQPLSGRYRRARLLGRGAFGEVWEAFDDKLGQRVAVKTLIHVDPRSLLRFKLEFRSLAQVAHRNLVTLHELVVEQDAWHLVLELVPGTDLLGWVRPDAVARAPEAANAATLTSDGLRSRGRADQLAPADVVVADEPVPPDYARLRDAMRQLVEGVDALHTAGWLHRDLKPSNVRVTPDGRLVVLDFGLVTAADPADPDASRGLVGTPHYMAPEQATGSPTSAATDWYAVGAILFHALTGHPPVEGSVAEILRRRVTEDGPDPRSLIADLPTDLADLAMALMRLDPAARPTTSAVRACFGGEERPPTSVVRNEVFVGRTSELDALQRAWRLTSAGAASVATISGVSGLGKSTLLSTFLARIAAEEPAACVLVGACYSGERVAHAGIDSLVDALVARLRRWPEAEVAAVLPRDSSALAQLFPVVKELPGVAQLRTRSEGGDAEVRGRALLALRELVERLALRRPVVLAIEDLQWLDEDGASVLRELIRPPRPPAILVVLTWRSDEVERSLPLSRLVEHLRTLEGLSLTSVALQPLAPDDALRAAAAWGGAERAAEIALESGGSPMFIQALAQGGGGAHAGLAGLLRSQVEALPEDARLALELVALAGHPLNVQELASAVNAASASPDRLAETIAALRVARLVRVHVEDAVSPYHARIAEAATGRLTVAEQADRHRWLAAGLSSVGLADPERLAAHHAASGDVPRALDRTLEAAEAAARALAFRHAADLYARAIDQAERASVSIDRPTVRARLAEALANAGQCEAAGRIYLDLAEQAAAGEAHGLRMLAVRQLFRSPAHDEARHAVARLLGAHGVTVYEAGPRAILVVLARLLRLLVRGFRWRAPTGRVDPSLVQRVSDLVETCYSMTATDAFMLAQVTPVAARAALDLGLPEYIGPALGLTMATSVDVLPAGWVDRLMDIAADATEKTGTRDARDRLGMCQSGVQIFRGNYRRAVDIAAALEARWATEGRAMPPESSSIRLIMAGGMTGALQFGRAVEWLATIRGVISRTGDLHASLIHVQSAEILIAGDQAELALTRIDEVMRDWGDTTAASRPHGMATYYRMRAFIGAGRPRDAVAHFDAHADSLRRAGMLDAPYYATLLRAVRAIALLHVARAAPANERTELHRQVARELRYLWPLPGWFTGSWRLGLKASLLAAQGHTAAALRALGRAEAIVSDDLAHVVAHRSLAAHLRGDTAAIAAIDASLREEGVVDPVRYLDGFVPLPTLVGPR